MTDSDGNFIGNANGKFITDSAGTFTITDIAPGTTLIIKETRAKDGYLLDDTPQTVKVKSNEMITLEFRNQPLGGLRIIKLIASRRSLWKGFSSASPTATAALWQMRVVSSLPTVFI